MKKIILILILLIFLIKVSAQEQEAVIKQIRISVDDPDFNTYNPTTGAGLIAIITDPDNLPLGNKEYVTLSTNTQQNPNWGGFGFTIQNSGTSIPYIDTAQNDLLYLEITTENIGTDVIQNAYTCWTGQQIYDLQQNYLGYLTNTISHKCPTNLYAGRTITYLHVFDISELPNGYLDYYNFLKNSQKVNLDNVRGIIAALGGQDYSVPYVNSINYIDPIPQDANYPNKIQKVSQENTFKTEIKITVDSNQPEATIKFYNRYCYLDKPYGLIGGPFFNYDEEIITIGPGETYSDIIECTMPTDKALYLARIYYGYCVWENDECKAGLKYRNYPKVGSGEEKFLGIKYIFPRVVVEEGQVKVRIGYTLINPTTEYGLDIYSNDYNINIITKSEDGTELFERSFVLDESIIPLINPLNPQQGYALLKGQELDDLEDIPVDVSDLPDGTYTTYLETIRNSDSILVAQGEADFVVSGLQQGLSGGDFYPVSGIIESVLNLELSNDLFFVDKEMTIEITGSDPGILVALDETYLLTTKTITVPAGGSTPVPIYIKYGGPIPEENLLLYFTVNSYYTEIPSDQETNQYLITVSAFEMDTVNLIPILTDAPLGFFVNEPETISFKVKNFGNLDVEDKFTDTDDDNKFKISLLDNSIEVNSQAVDLLSAGASVDLNFEYISSEVGTHTLEIKVDSFNEVDENKENDNTLILTRSVFSAEEQADTDGDGLTDVEEITIYFTDPDNPDTDSDGLLDGEEVDIFGPFFTESEWWLNDLDLDDLDPASHDLLDGRNGPNDWDTDDDGISDYDEIYGELPTDPTADPSDPSACQVSCSKWKPDTCPAEGKRTRTCTIGQNCPAGFTVPLEKTCTPTEGIPVYTTISLILTLLILTIYYSIKTKKHKKQ